jgi:phage shock protein PspC (stress-responsive transcriptional regulator)
MNPTSTQQRQPSTGPLRRPIDGRILGGVAAGLARHFALDVTYIRIAFVALCLLGGAGVPLYLAAWILIPAQGSGISLGDDVASHIGRRLSRVAPAAAACVIYLPA